MALRILTKFQLEILIRSTISAIHKFQENLLESLWNVSETTWANIDPDLCCQMASLGQQWVKRDSFLYSFMGEYSWVFLEVTFQRNKFRWQNFENHKLYYHPYQKNDNENNTNAFEISGLSEQFEEVRNRRKWINMC